MLGSTSLSSTEISSIIYDIRPETFGILNNLEAPEDMMLDLVVFTVIVGA